MPQYSTAKKLCKGILHLKPTVFICDDEPEILRYLEKLLGRNGYTVETFQHGYDLLKRIADTGTLACNALLMDVRMPDMDGLHMLKYVRSTYHTVPVVLMTGHGTIDDAVQAIKMGAYDYITKPFPQEQILGILQEIVYNVQTPGH